MKSSRSRFLAHGSRGYYKAARVNVTRVSLRVRGSADEDTKERSLRSYEMMVESRIVRTGIERGKETKGRKTSGEEVEEEDAGGCIPAR